MRATTHKLLGAILAVCMLLSCAAGLSSPAEAAADEKIIVSLGDSYSSGEGLPPFYGQDKEASAKVEDPDWLAHRSTLAWPGRLTLGGVSGAMAENRGAHWYFAASSGATTEHLTQTQKKTYNVAAADGTSLSGSTELKAQLDIFDEVEGSVDYVTVTIGGNDIGFVSIVTSAVTQNESELKAVLDRAEKNYHDTVRGKIKAAYYDIAEKAGAQAAIIVAGYPTLLSADGDSSGRITPQKAGMINDKVSWFNAELETLTAECRGEGLNIWFASVESRFKGHEAYTAEPHINGIALLAQEQDLNRYALVSSASMHPNEFGAADYASAVQEVLDTLEREGAVPTSAPATVSGFTDVTADAYYADAVKWAVDSGVTNGTSDTTFSPDADLTRAQAVTFLWRAKGSPAPTSAVNPFTDVKADEYCYDAVLWAVEQGITNGVSATEFGVNGRVTRGQMVTFLWRTEGKPNDFGGAWYAAAESWAQSKGLLAGTAQAYETNANCPRADVVYYLWKSVGTANR